MRIHGTEAVSGTRTFRPKSLCPCDKVRDSRHFAQTGKVVILSVKLIAPQEEFCLPLQPSDAVSDKAAGGRKGKETTRNPKMALRRFGVSLEDDLLSALDNFARDNGFANRSQAIRFLIEKNVTEEKWQCNHLVAGTVVLMYDRTAAGISRRIDSILYEKYPEVILVSASAGASSADNAFSAMQTTGSHIINYNLRLPRSSERERSIYVISDLLRTDLDRIPEIEEYTVSPGGTGSMGGSSNVKIKVYGYDMNVTNDVANDLKDRIARIPGIRDANLSRDDLRPEYNVVFDRDRLAYYGLTSATASQAVRNRINGLDASKYREDGDEYDIVVRYGEPYRTRLEDVEEIVLYGSDGRPVKLKEVGEVREEFAAPSIERENRQRVIYVEASLGAGVALGEVVTAINGLLRDYAVPAGVDLELGGTVEDQGDAFGDLLTLLALIVILVYIVMATQFESLVYPFLIMFTIPLAFTGVFLALWGTGTPLSLIALIGAIMLVGIVTKNGIENGIVLVDYTNLLVERGASLFDAVVAGGKSRLRPVLMTSFTTILGMLPLALGTGEGSETWQPMGIAVIGGLTFSTLLTLLVVPVLYSVFVNRRIRKTLPGQAEPLV